MRRLPPDIVGAREWAESSEALQVAFQELRPHSRDRVGVVVAGESPGDVLLRMAATVNYYLRPARAGVIAAEGIQRGLFALEERKREDGGEGTEHVFIIKPLPPSVWRARYEDRRGPRGGLTEAERARRHREKVKEEEAKKRTAAGDGSSAPVPAVATDTSSAPSAAISTTPEMGVTVATDTSSAPSAASTVTAPVTASSRSAVPSSPSPSPQDTPFRGGVRGGEGSERMDPPTMRPDTITDPNDRKATERKRGTAALRLLANGTAKSLCPDASGVEVRQLGKVLATLGYGDSELTQVATHWAQEPEAWRKAVDRDSAKGPRCTVMALLGRRTDNVFTGSGLRSALELARSWEAAQQAAKVRQAEQEQREAQQQAELARRQAELAQRQAELAQRQAERAQQEQAAATEAQARLEANKLKLRQQTEQAAQQEQPGPVRATPAPELAPTATGGRRDP